ncbi:reverse transcriptase domain-containing protein [Cetobacterium sp.]|uniref:reverse transcriptase domain-containing protein n=1 Tax=Cetobacterium sp. TaxID=2071632 RepID=UPI003EE5BE11
MLPIENGTSQGSVSSPILFNLLINDIYYTVDNGIGRSLYADDGALWKRGRNENEKNLGWRGVCNYSLRVILKKISLRVLLGSEYRQSIAQEVLFKYLKMTGTIDRI